MASAIPKFRLFGIPIQVEPFFAIVLALFGFAMYSRAGTQFVVSFAVIAAVSILIHELGHALAFKAFGLQPSILLHGMGGLTSSSGHMTPVRNLVVTLAGPVPPLVFIGLPALSMLRSSGYTFSLVQPFFQPTASVIFLQQLVFVNLVWSLLNLIPVLPLDGGIVSASILEMIVKGRGRQIANVISILIAGALGLWALSMGELILPVMAVFLVGLNIMELTRSSRGSDALAADEPLAEAHRALLQGQPQMAEHLAHDAAVRARDLEEQRWANELLAWARLFSGDIYGAHQQAAVMAPSRPPSQSFYGSLALASGRRDEGITVLAWALAREPAGPAKSLAAVAAARAGATDDLAFELRAMGTDGAESARLLQELLDDAGYREQAAAVASGRPVPRNGQDPGDAAAYQQRYPGYEPPPAPQAPVAWPPVDRPAPPAPASPSAPPPLSWPRQPPASPPTTPSPWQRPEY